MRVIADTLSARLLRRSFLLLLITLGLPVLAHAQASIAGVVKDTSGAVLPGVTVEAASPVLIEKLRTVVTNANGQYQIVDLRPGAYVVTFTLAGFNTVRREGVTLTGSFTASVDVELRIGDLAETITVTGEAPLVDAQTTTKQAVIDRTIVDTIPSDRNQYRVALLIPGMGTTGGQDVGGTAIGQNQNLSIHGGRGDGQRIAQNGLTTATVSALGSTAGAVPNMAAVQEVAVDFAAVSAEMATGGVRMNLIPREGGNTFAGTNFFSYAGSGMQGDNITDDLISRGMAPNAGKLLKRVWDVNPGFGGPIKRDRAWFFASIRWNATDNWSAGNAAFNANEGNPASWTWLPDTSRDRPNVFAEWKDATGRVNVQVSPRNKVAVSYNQQTRCNCSGGSVTVSPESFSVSDYPLQRSVQGDWTSPLTSRLLLEASMVTRVEGYYALSNGSQPLVAVTEQGGLLPGLTYRGFAGIPTRMRTGNVAYRASLAYVTGTHNFKVGFNDLHGSARTFPYAWDVPYSYRVNNGVPNQITLRAQSPLDRTQNDLDHDMGFFAQDRWTIGRLVLSGGVRYDYFASSFPVQTIGPSPLAPNRNFTFEAASNKHYHDVTPKMGAVYDLSGRGKTVLRITLNKYVEGLGAGGGNNPTAGLINTTTRAWNDTNGDFVPQCDLAVPGANGECGAMAQAAFGQVVPATRWADDVLGGFGKRGYNWEFSTGVQHELVPRVAVDVGFFRRWYGNFTVTDNVLTGPSDYTQFSLLAPTNVPSTATSGLPNAGQPVTGLYDLNPDKVGQVQNVINFSNKYGKEIDHWNGVDVNVTARMDNGLTLSGGLSTGRTTQDICEIVEQVPEMLAARHYFGPNGVSNGGGNNAPGSANNTTAWTPGQFCRIQTPFLTQVKGYAVYTVPKVAVQLSGAWQSVPGPLVQAYYVANNAVVAPALGRTLSGGAQNITVNVVDPGTMYGERLNQIDVRASKVFRFGTRRATVGIDLYNLLNQSAVLTQSNVFSNWMTPQSLIAARFLKFSTQLDF